MLGLATTNLYTKFEISTLIHYKDIKGDKNATRGSAMAEGPRDVLVSRNCVTTKHPI